MSTTPFLIKVSGQTKFEGTVFKMSIKWVSSLPVTYSEVTKRIPKWGPVKWTNYNCEIHALKITYIIDRRAQRTFYHDWSLITTTERNIDKIYVHPLKWYTMQRSYLTDTYVGSIVIPKRYFLFVSWKQFALNEILVCKIL